ncbi:putative oxidoreductase [compost metagenome]
MMYKHEDYQQALNYVVSGQLVLKALITHRFDFQDYNEAYAFIEKNASQTMKVLIDVN